ncbi:hypothetical protein K9B32_09020 [Rhizobium sp. 3T7]|nr:hypothetical protein [Rhizobium sp. 3T7]MBZ9790269.1 hypothetical protein [Rhizobium sp. 3T7]
MTIKRLLDDGVIADDHVEGDDMAKPEHLIGPVAPPATSVLAAAQQAHGGRGACQRLTRAPAAGPDGVAAHQIVE